MPISGMNSYGQTYTEPSPGEAAVAAQNAAGQWRYKSDQLASDTQRYGYDQQAAQNAANNATQMAGYDTQRYGYDTNAATQRYSTDVGAAQNAANNATQRYGYDTNASTQRYGYDTQVKQTGMQTDTQRYIADQNNKLGYANLNQSGDQFNRAYGTLSGLLANPDQFGGAATSAQPKITTGPIWTPEQIQQQVNQSTAQQVQSAQTQQQTAANKMAGQGFGSRSPALAQMQANAMSQAIANSAANAGNIRYQAAEGNAKQQLGSEQAAQSGWYADQQQDIARRGVNSQYKSSLAAALAGLV